MSLALASEEESYLDIRSVRKAAPRTFLHATKTATVKQGEPSAGEHQQGTPPGKDLPAPPVSARDRQFAASGASESHGGMRDHAQPLQRGQQADAPNRLLKKCRSDSAAYQNPENPSRNGI